MKMESFDAVHRGACPGCGFFDNGSHIVHRYWRKDCNGDFITPEGNTQAFDTFVAAKVKRANKFMRDDLAKRGIIV